MPIYEYDCPRCGRFDTLQKMSSPALKIHDVCGCGEGGCGGCPAASA